MLCVFYDIVKCSHKRRQRRGSGRSKFILLRDPRERRHDTICWATWERHQLARRQKTETRGRFRPPPLLGLPQEKKGKAEKDEQLGLTSLNYFYGFWGVSVVPSSLAPGPWMIKAEE